MQSYLERKKARHNIISPGFVCRDLNIIEAVWDFLDTALQCPFMKAGELKRLLKENTRKPGQN